MKTILALCPLVTSLNTFAFEKTATLDFTNLYGKTNLGHYDVKVTFNEKKTQSVGELSTYVLPDDGDIYCETTVAYNVGDIVMTITDRESGWSKTFTEVVTASQSAKTLGDECNTDLAQFVGKQTLYTRFNIGSYTKLNEVAFKGYEGIAAHFNPFNGYLLLNAEANVVNGKLVVDASEILSERSISETNINNNEVTYYVYAYKKASTLSLGTSSVKFDQ
ncbi:MAG: hypothetical protein K2Q18_14190 [Bdellovibrionales bacterium]|nr:hypothetical protein [Bdellovibrionales bacterium]